jgi:hypothetical protein
VKPDVHARGTVDIAEIVKLLRQLLPGPKTDVQIEQFHRSTIELRQSNFSLFLAAFMHHLAASYLARGRS